jgi:retron-type reverse transcriptase
MDLERFFDTVVHGKLIEVLSRTIKDGRVVSLIHKYLNAGVIQQDGRFGETLEGVPQGGPLSPLLGNVLLNELDWELERRGHISLYDMPMTWLYYVKANEVPKEL